MKSIQENADCFIRWVEGLRITPVHLVTLFIGIGLFRNILEDFSSGASPIHGAFLAVHSVSFYFLVYFLFAVFLMLLVGREQIKNWMFLGLFLGLLPPILDIVFFNHFDTGDRAYTYLYSFDFDFFTPYQMIGESVTLWIVIAVTAFIILVKTRNAMKAVAGCIIAYCLLQFLIFGISIVGSAITNAVETVNTVSNSNNFVHGIYSLLLLFIGSVCMTLFYKEVFRATIKRIHHAFIFGALVLVGSQIAGVFSFAHPFVLLEAFVFFFAFVLAQAENDFYDKKLDALTGRDSAIGTDEMYFVRFLQMMLILSVAMIDFSMVSFLLFFFVLSFAYSHGAIRLKRNFVGGSVAEGLLCLSCLMAGAYSLYGSAEFSTSVFPIIVLISAGFAICSNFKDYKDFEGDMKGGVTTLYVWLYTKWNIKPRTTNQIIAGALAVSSLTLLTVTHYFLPNSDLGLLWSLGLLTALLPVLSLLLIKKPRMCVSVTIIAIVVFLISYAFCVGV